MAGAMASKLIAALANRGQVGASPMGMTAPGGMGGGQDDQGQPNLTQKVGSELADIQGADPQAIKGLLMQLKQQLVALIPHTAFRIPGISKHISKALDNINAAMGEADKALQTTQMASNTPIGMSAVQNAAGTAGPGV